MDQLYQRQNGELDVSLLSQLRLNLRYLEEQIVRQQTLLRELDALLLVRRQAVVKARQDEEVLATLRRKETERYEAELARREGNLQDDIYIAQAFRRSMQVQH
jgi:flagellar biosynthesis chaperone FliJ